MIDRALDRRRFLGRTAAAATVLASHRALGASIDLRLPSAPRERELTKAFPQKSEMVLQRTRPVLLETPFSVFDEGVFTPNDRFFVRWHLAGVPDSIEVATYRLSVGGLVERPLSLSLAEVMALPRFEIVAVNQCSGNSRGFFQPRVAGGQWGNGAMGNARWTGVRLSDVLAKAGIKAGAVDVQFDGLDEGVLSATPDFKKSLGVDHARDGEVMIAYAMNGEPLPLLNGFPLRLVVPGWYSTYWMKMLTRIEVLGKADDNFWMKTAYRIPDTPGASVKPGEKGFKTVPINRMVPRSFITNLSDGSVVKAAARAPVRGIALGGDTGVAAVELSYDAGSTWAAARLGKDEGKYSFRRFEGEFDARAPGAKTILVRARNDAGLVQPSTPIWNGGGYMLNTIEATSITIA